jgi:hypothetical protein
MTEDGANTGVNDPARYDRMPKEEQQALREWIAAVLRPATRVHHDHTSYGLKHVFEGDNALGTPMRRRGPRVRLRTGFYVDNGQFKGAMLAAGYEPEDRSAMNWLFRFRWARRRGEA